MTYVVQSCPHCGKKLLKVAAGAYIIGSPLITCKKCGGICRTALRKEWYEYPTKWTLWALPVLIAGGILLTGACMGEPAIGVMGAIFGLVLGLCFTVKDVIRMLKSKKRMRNREYLARLLMYDVISAAEYEQLMKDAG